MIIPMPTHRTIGFSALEDISQILHNLLIFAFWITWFEFIQLLFVDNEMWTISFLCKDLKIIFKEKLPILQDELHYVSKTVHSEAGGWHFEALPCNMASWTAGEKWTLQFLTVAASYVIKFLWQPLCSMDTS